MAKVSDEHRIQILTAALEDAVDALEKEGLLVSAARGRAALLLANLPDMPASPAQ